MIIKHLFTEYLIKQFIIGITVTIIGGIGIYNISLKKDKEYNPIEDYQKILIEANKFISRTFILIPYKEKLDLNIELLRVYNPNLYNKIREPLSKAEWGLIKLRESNYKDFLESVNNSMKEIMKLNLRDISNNEKMNEFVKNVANYPFSKDKKINMKKYHDNAEILKKQLIKFLEEEQKTKSYKKLINAFL